jgi:4-amino-4-deoxy-L-arabinose transferase-like glycosyltransferase
VNLWRQLATKPLFGVGMVTLAFVLPFAGKAFHIDDPLFVWSAQHIAEHPSKFYGFDVNWFGVTLPMWMVNLNPPMTSYFLALIGSVLGWSETALHLCFSVWTCAFCLGCYVLSRRWCARPALAASVALFSPVTLVCATSVMSDMPMAALWVWAVVLWVRGTDERRARYLAVGMGLTSLAILAKYSAVSLVPLLLSYSFLRRTKALLLPILGSFLIPLATVLVFGAWTRHLYDRDLLSSASDYSSVNRLIFESGLDTKWLIGLAFLGGGFAPALFFVFQLWSRTAVWSGAALCFALGGVATVLGKLGPIELLADGATRWGVLVQVAVLAGAGSGVVILTVRHALKRRDPVSWMLCAWILGTGVFAVVFNWTIATRSFLPAVPALAILLVRVLEDRARAAIEEIRIWWPVVPSAALSLWIVSADFSLANSARAAAREIASSYPPGQHPLWFEGHWGFQFYMQQAGAKAFDVKSSQAAAGDIVVLPENNSNVFPLSDERVESLAVIVRQPNSLLTTMDRTAGAGFYAADWGPLPFAIGHVAPERYRIVRVKEPPPDTNTPPIH